MNAKCRNFSKYWFLFDDTLRHRKSQIIYLCEAEGLKLAIYWSIWLVCTFLEDKVITVKKLSESVLEIFSLAEFYLNDSSFFA